MGLTTSIYIGIFFVCVAGRFIEFKVPSKWTCLIFATLLMGRIYETKFSSVGRGPW